MRATVANGGNVRNIFSETQAKNILSTNAKDLIDSPEKAAMIYKAAGENIPEDVKVKVRENDIKRAASDKAKFEDQIGLNNL